MNFYYLLEVLRNSILLPIDTFARCTRVNTLQSVDEKFLMDKLYPTALFRGFLTGVFLLFFISATLGQPGVFYYPTLAITNPALNHALVGVVYPSETFTTSGGFPPYSFVALKGGLPPGMSLSSSGVLSGTPTTTGTFTFQVNVYDTDVGNGLELVSLTVDPPQITGVPDTLSPGVYQSAYASVTFTANGGTPPYSFSGSSLPPGMSLSDTGVLTGTPMQAGSFSFLVYAKDNSTGIGGPFIGTQKYYLTINPAALKVTANSDTMTYGGTLPALSVSYSGFVNSNTISNLTALATDSTMATSQSPAGVYPIVASGAADSNYSISYYPGTLTINPAALKVAANAQSKVYGSPDPGFGYTVTGYANGDNSDIFTGSLTRNPGENVGIYPIGQGTLSAGKNYVMNFTGSDLTITKAPQEITWNQSLLFGCDSARQLQLTATVSSGLPITYTSAHPGVATVAGDALTLVQPGTTVITATQPGDGNHYAAPDLTDTAVYQALSLVRQHWNDVLFFDNSSDNYVQWQWYKNNDPIPGAVGQDYNSAPSVLNGQYYVIATDKTGNTIQSCPLTITAGGAIPEGIKVYPNPTSPGSSVTIHCNYPAASLQGAQMLIADLLGTIRQQITNVQPSMQVTMPAGGGMYIIKLQLANGQVATVNVLVTK